MVRLRTPRFGRSAAKAMLVVAALVSSGLVAAAPAGAAPVTSTASALSTSSLGSRGDYLALGDSIPFGFSPLESIPGTNASNFKGYPEYIARLTGLNLANASCPGETTQSLIDGKDPYLGPSYLAAGNDLHVDYTGQSQLEYAVGYLQSHPNTRLVTLTIGANDVFRCQAIIEQGGDCDLEKTVGQAGANLADILSRLRSNDEKGGNYSGPLVWSTTTRMTPRRGGGGNPAPELRLDPGDAGL